MNFTPLDIVLIGVAIYSIYSGWRRGLIMGLFSVLGVVAGLWVANSSLLVFYGASSDVDLKRVSISTFVFLAGVLAGSTAGAIIGHSVQKLVARGPLKLINKLGGAGLATISWALTVWLIGGFLIGLPNTSVSNALNDSVVVTKLDSYAPIQIRNLIEATRSAITTSQLPEVAIDALVGPDVTDPDPTITQDPEIAAALASVARIESVTEECNLKLSGSGFVIADNLVVTNAHVVAGITKPNVRIGGKGKAVSGKVIYFDPDIDLALIRTTKLTAPALSLGESLRRSDLAVIPGFPGGGSLTLIPARVQRVAQSQDSDIYGKLQVTRELYVLRADVKSGDSGSALLDENGRVSGVIFAASATEQNIGYALTINELKNALAKGAQNTSAADTGACIPAK